ncbi:hypothetical protein D3C78_1165630 [compost metagenome]
MVFSSLTFTTFPVVLILFTKIFSNLPVAPSRKSAIFLPAILFILIVIFLKVKEPVAFPSGPSISNAESDFSVWMISALSIVPE